MKRSSIELLMAYLIAMLFITVVLTNTLDLPVYMMRLVNRHW